jgi:glycosyltransferase involved in cell wall biosynthesis
VSAAVPAISVVMTSYADPLSRLKRAVDSILSQTVRDLELLVSFEPGDANAEALEREYADKRLVVIRNCERKGMAGSFNSCLAVARGRYIARMDSDDVSYPERFEKQLAFLRDHPDIAVLGGGIDIVDEQGERLGTRLFGVDHHAIVRRFALINAMCHPTIMWDRGKVGEALRYDERRAHAEDLELWFRLLSQGHRFANMQEPLIQYKQTDEWRRKIENWRTNFRVRAAYWWLAFRYPSLLIGVVAFSLLVIMPKSVIDYLTHRSRFSDFIRSIRSLDTTSRAP